MVASYETDRPNPVNEGLTTSAEDVSLLTFTTNIFGHLPRVDQRRWAHAYVTALLRTKGKKSIRRLADTISPSPAATAQSLRQFVNLSPWDWRPVLHALTRWAEGHGPVTAWSIGRALLPKRGEQSVGVHRQFDPSSGQTLNSQLGLGAFLRIGTAHVPVGWRLYMPHSWINDPRLRQRTRVPETEHYRSPWSHALGLVDALAAASASSPVVADMSDDPDVRLFIQALNERRHTLVVAVSPHFKVIPGERSASTASLLSAKTCLSSGTVRDVIVAEPDGAQRRTRILSAPVRLPHFRPSTAPERPHQLFAECGPGSRLGPVWISTLPERRLSDAVSLTALTTSTTSTITAMARCFGLLDFEGRSFPGWHHHMALVSTAYAFQRLGRSRPPMPPRLGASEPDQRASA
ncbi:MULTISPECIES: IS701 family transposase [Streptomyces]|uniref:Transposase n=1 Tax=Streptomyces siderophoricus TaxID=2802281 RepID=A0ABS1MT68_9ACTN|nr:transposase [Streptomyces sp. 9-7]MBL1090945.1 transposase [Streptomyces sp. 9-7]